MESETLDTAFVDACVQRMRSAQCIEQEAQREGVKSVQKKLGFLSQLLGEHYGAKRVWLFGSFAWGEPHKDSDVDVLVEGLNAKVWAKAMVELERHVGRPVDLVCVEDAPKELVQRVVVEGLLLHGTP